MAAVKVVEGGWHVVIRSYFANISCHTFGKGLLKVGEMYVDETLKV